MSGHRRVGRRAWKSRREKIGAARLVAHYRRVMQAMNKIHERLIYDRPVGQRWAIIDGVFYEPWPTAIRPPEEPCDRDE